ncbi:MAG: lipocalin family protein [Tidjanibacter sp.]|nr:lipocalin family protein [Tidjanibacter sp.]
MKKLFFTLMTLVLAGTIVSCNKPNNEVPLTPDEPTNEMATSHIEMYVTSEAARWNKTLFSTDKLGEWWKPTGSKFYIGKDESGVTQFFLTRGQLEYDYSPNNIHAVVEFCFNIPADVPLVVGTKYYFGEIKNPSRLDCGVILEDPSSDKKNFIELRTGIYKFVSTSGWFEFSMIDQATIDGRDVYTLDMTFGFEGFDETRGVATCEVPIGRVTNNPGECNVSLYYWTESGWVAETAVVESFVAECSDFDAEALVEGLVGEWELDSMLVYDAEWEKIEQPHRVMGVGYAEGLGYSKLTFNADGTGNKYVEFTEPGVEPETMAFEWQYDADSHVLTLSGDYNAKYVVAGFNGDHIVCDYVYNGDNIRDILKRKAE